jgi:hypothetical protein
MGAAWPSVGVTPLLQVNATGGQVHAFRVEASTSHGLVDFSGENEYVMSELSVSSGGWITPQGSVACDYFWNLFPLANLKHHSVMVRLYRPGCQTVEIGAWDLPQEVKWTGAADLAGQEKAVDDLLETWRANSIREMEMQQERNGGQEPSMDILFAGLAPGSKSSEHRQVLLFAAAEYKRLAKGAPADEASRAVRERMEQKAAWLREHAEK